MIQIVLAIGFLASLAFFIYSGFQAAKAGWGEDWWIAFGTSLFLVFFMLMALLVVAHS